MLFPLGNYMIPHEAGFDNAHNAHFLVLYDTIVNNLTIAFRLKNGERCDIIEQTSQRYHSRKEQSV